jgi:hypothetical protein
LIPFEHSNGDLNCLLYADNIVLIAKSSGHLKKLLAAAEADSIERGYKFSLTKCVVVSPGRRVHKLYGSSLERKEVLPYLGMEVSSKGLAWRNANYLVPMLVIFLLEH